MITKLAPCRYFWIVLLVVLTACVPAVTSAPTETPMPTTTFTPILPTATLMLEFTPIPTLPPPPILTPDAIQVTRWKEYQTALAKAVLYGYGPDSYKDALCEWDILGRSGQEVYVWAYCATFGGGSGSRPSVIYLEADGSIRNVRVAGYKGASYDLGLFPADVQEKCGLYTGYSLFNGRLKEMIDHLHYRRDHPEEPPLVVLSAMPTTTPAP